MTSLHAAQWQKTTLPQFLVAASFVAAETSKQIRRTPKALDIVMMIAGEATQDTFTSLGSAVKSARAKLADNEQLTIALAYAYDNVDATLEALTTKGPSASILVSYEIAASIALSETSENVAYAGIIKGPSERLEHVYRMRG